METQRPRKRQTDRQRNINPEQPPTDSCPLLNLLPPELRVRIYEYALQRDEIPLTITSWRGSHGCVLKLAVSGHRVWSQELEQKCMRKTRRSSHARNIARYKLAPQLLRTCRMIHDEAAPCLYSQARQFSDQWTVHLFQHMIGLRNLGFLREIGIADWCWWNDRGEYKCDYHKAVAIWTLMASAKRVTIVKLPKRDVAAGQSEHERHVTLTHIPGRVIVLEWTGH